MAKQNGMEEINSEYIRGYFKDKGLSITEESRNIGKSRSYLAETIRRGVIDKTSLMFLCKNTGMDYKKATGKQIEKKDDLETAELIISYIQDLGKINSELIREVRETRTQLKEVLEKLTIDFHSIDVYFRNAIPTIRDQHSQTNNNLSMIGNYIQKKGEKQCQK